MSDRVQSLTIVLDKDYRTDDVEHIVAALRMVRGVADVTLGPVMDINAYTARETTLREFITGQIEFLVQVLRGTPESKQIMEILGRCRREMSGRGPMSQ